jgi:hypothetical protein
MVAPGNGQYQELFIGETPEGVELKLVKLSDGRCAICRAGDMIRFGQAGEDGMHRLIEEFLALLKDSDSGSRP